MSPAESRLPSLHLLLVLVLCAGWGGNFLAAKVALHQFPPFLCTGLRLGIVLLCLFPFLRPVPRGQRVRLVAVALANGALHFALVFSALRAAGEMTSVAIALQSYVPMSALLALVLVGERPRWQEVLGIALAFAGVVIVKFDPRVLDAPGALGLTLSAAFMLALGTTLMRGLKDVGVFSLQAWTALIGCPVLLGLSALLERDQLALVSSAAPRHWVALSYTAIVASLLCHGMLYWLVQRHPVARVTPYLLLVPVIASGLDWLVLGHRPGPQLIVGGVTVLTGVAVVALPRKSRAEQGRA